jgi:hypothetical protein
MVPNRAMTHLFYQKLSFIDSETNDEEEASNVSPFITNNAYNYPDNITIFTSYNGQLADYSEKCDVIRK